MSNKVVLGQTKRKAIAKGFFLYCHGTTISGRDTYSLFPIDISSEIVSGDTKFKRSDFRQQVSYYKNTNLNFLVKYTFAWNMEDLDELCQKAKETFMKMTDEKKCWVQFNDTGNETFLAMWRLTNDHHGSGHKRHKFCVLIDWYGSVVPMTEEMEGILQQDWCIPIRK